MDNRIRICINDEEINYKVTSIYLLSDGSFKIDVPYCNHEEGVIEKFHLPEDFYGKTTSLVSNEERESFFIKNRPQLSIHASGFVQFSGKGILSGIDKNTGKPKGLALNSNPLSSPISFGPTCSILLWGLSKGYDVANKAESINYIIPGKAFKSRIFDDKEIIHSYQIEIWVFPLNEYYLNAIQTDANGKEFIILKFPNYLLAPGSSFVMGVIRLKNINSFLALLPSRVHVQQSEESDFGFYLSSPSEKIKEGGWKALHAFSPVPKQGNHFSAVNFPYLDYYG